MNSDSQNRNLEKKLLDDLKQAHSMFFNTQLKIKKNYDAFSSEDLKEIEKLFFFAIKSILLLLKEKEIIDSELKEIKNRFENFVESINTIFFSVSEDIGGIYEKINILCSQLKEEEDHIEKINETVKSLLEKLEYIEKRIKKVPELEKYVFDLGSCLEKLHVSFFILQKVWDYEQKIKLGEMAIEELLEKLQGKNPDYKKLSRNEQRQILEDIAKLEYDLEQQQESFS